MTTDIIVALSIAIVAFFVLIAIWYFAILPAKKKALIGYIQEKVDEFSRRREALEETLSSSNIKDPRSSVEQVRKEIAELQENPCFCRIFCDEEYKEYVL